MTIIIRVPGVSWAAKGFPNVDPFINAGLVYGFDFSQRNSMLTDVTGKHAITPKRTDTIGGVFNVTDHSVVIPVNNGQGVRVERGYLQSSELIPAPFGHGGPPFTLMVVGCSGGVAFSPGEVVGSAPSVGILYDCGSNVSGTGFTMEFGGASVAAGRISGRIEAVSPNLTPEAVGSTRDLTVPNVVFLTYDGTNWTLINKTRGVSATGTNASLGVGNPIVMGPGAATEGRVNLGGHANQTSTAHAWYPTLYQSAKWSRVLSANEINDQYLRTKAGRPLLIV